MHIKFLALAALSTGLLLSCSSTSDSPVSPTPTPTPNPQNPTQNEGGRYVLAVSTSASGNASTTLLLSPKELTKGATLTTADGLQIDGGTEYIYLDNQHYLYAIAYHQGGRTTTSSFILQGDRLTKRNPSFQGQRFTTYGTFQGQLITSSTGVGTGLTKDAAGYDPQAFLLTYLNPKAETQTFNTAISAENFLGDGEYVTLCGLQEHDGKLFSGIIPMGLSQYGGNVDAVWNGDNYVSGRWVKSGNENLIKTQDGGSRSSTYKRGELQWTQYPDACHVAIFSGRGLENKKVITSDKISYPAGRFKSQYYQMIWPDASGDLYVFSPSFAKTMTDARQKTTLPAGVLRIKQGTEVFDDSYYYNLDQLSRGRGFQHVFPVGEDKFLIYLFNESFDRLTNQQQATNLALFHARTGQWEDITGLPLDITQLGGKPLVENGVAYVPIMTQGSRPAIYAIDLSRAHAELQLSVEANAITSIGYLRAQR